MHKHRVRSRVRIVVLCLVAAQMVGITPARAALDTIALRDIAMRKNVYVGTMLWGVYRNETTDVRLMQKVCTEFNMLSTGNALKWEVVHPRENEWNWGPGERLWRIATACNQKFVGTPLVWKWQLPAWVLRHDGDPVALRRILKDHITTLVTHFKGKVAAWDVVNEAIGFKGELIEDIWVRNLGPGYIADAYRWARAADPEAELYYNDFASDGFGRKGNGVYQWVRYWLGEGAPIDGVGFQAHGVLESKTQKRLVANLRRYAALGLDTRMSEIAIPIGPETAPDLRAQAQRFRMLASACFAPGTGCVMFTVWGVTDRDYRPVAAWKGSCCGLLFDENFQRKPAYFAVREALQSAS